MITPLYITNITTGGTPDVSPVWQFRQEENYGLGQFVALSYKNNGGTVRTTTARTTNGQQGTQSTPTFNVNTSSALNILYIQ